MDLDFSAFYNDFDVELFHFWGQDNEPDPTQCLEAQQFLQESCIETGYSGMNTESRVPHDYHEESHYSAGLCRSQSEDLAQMLKDEASRIEDSNIDFDPAKSSSPFVPGLQVDPLAHTIETLPNGKSLTSAQKTRPRDILTAWARCHLDNVYPTPDEKEILSQQTGKSIKQISSFFANFRNRHLKSLLEHPQSVINEAKEMPEEIQTFKPRDAMASGNFDSTESSGKDSSRCVAAPSSPQSFLTPPILPRPEAAELINLNSFQNLKQSARSYEEHGFIIAWQLGLPEDNHYYSIQDLCASDLSMDSSDQNRDDLDSASVHANVLTGNFPVHIETFLTEPTPLRRRRLSSSSMKSYARSSRSRDGRSATSGESTAVSSVASARSSISRRGRRLQHVTVRTQKPHKCPRCFQGFLRSSDMRRHLKSICERSQNWVCRPLKYVRVQQTELSHALQPMCLCGVYTVFLPLCRHKAQECWVKPELQRTFYRLDQFRLHLASTHGLTQHLSSMDFRHFEGDQTQMSVVNAQIFERWRSSKLAELRDNP